MAAVIDQTGLQQPVLVAWSYGGYIVTDYLRAYGDARIGGINLVGAAVILRPPAFDHIGPGLLGNAQEMCAPDLSANIAATQRFLRACTSRPLGDDEAATALAWNMVVPSAVRGALLSRELDASDVLASVSVPVLVTHGQDDAIVLPSMAEHTLTVCPAATASWYDGVRHMPFWEAPHRFDRELADLARAAGSPYRCDLSPDSPSTDVRQPDSQPPERPPGKRRTRHHSQMTGQPCPQAPHRPAAAPDTPDLRALN